jgi:hypothetical protein
MSNKGISLERLKETLSAPELQCLTCVQLAKRHLADGCMDAAFDALKVDADKIRMLNRDLYELMSKNDHQMDVFYLKQFITLVKKFQATDDVTKRSEIMDRWAQIETLSGERVTIDEILGIWAERWEVEAAR